MASVDTSPVEVPPPPLERFASLSALPGLVHGITTRAGGHSAGPYASLNVGRGCGDDQDAVWRNRERLRRGLGCSRFETAHQVHGAALEARAGTEAQAPGACDGLSTSDTGLLLGVLGADCPGVLLVAPAAHALAVVHAGWRGVAAGIVTAALARLAHLYGADAPSLQVGIGPGISRERYEVSQEVAEKILEAVPRSARDLVVRAGRPGHAHVDLQAAIRAQLVHGGVPAAAIETHPSCTYDDARFFSHRRDAGVTGRHALVAGWVD